MKIIIIAAIAENRVIGNKGGIPWHSSDEMRRAELKHFKETTNGHAVIMGRSTYQSIGRPLPNRLNIVLSRNTTEIDGVHVCKSIQEAIDYCKSQGYEKIFMLGGSSVFRESLPIATEIILTEIPGKYEGDTFFPEWSKDNWIETNRDKREFFTIVTYVRKTVE